MMNLDNAENLAQIAAEELGNAMTNHGIGHLGINVVDADTLYMSFVELADAEAMMTLGVTSDEVLGGLYDRSTSSCLSMSYLTDADASDEEFEDAEARGWTWHIHPAMRGRRMDWHVSLTLPALDANAVTANLNAVFIGGGAE